MESQTNIPEDLLVEIMSWLPVESLLRFKCVKKSWYHLIDALFHNQQFVAKHLKNSINRPSLYVIEGRRFKGLVPLCNANDSHIDTIIEDFGPRLPLKLVVNSHCNGILCLTKGRSRPIYLCNPVLNEVKIIKKSCFKRTHDPKLLGFGYDSISNVYKVVRVVLGASTEAEVHTLGVDERHLWRKINVDIKTPLVCIATSLFRQLQCKGVYYWLVHQAIGYPKIVSFDMHDEKFEIISLPDDPEDDDPDAFVHKRLCVWRDYVVLFKVNFNCPIRLWLAPRPIEMWVMHESYKGGHPSYSWIKHLTIPPLDKPYKPVIVWKNDELILSDRLYLASYNLATQKLRSFNQLSKMLNEVPSLTHVKSLVSINQLLG